MPSQPAKKPEESDALAPAPPADLPVRHARKCAICNHTEREAIEGDFLNWNEPARIVQAYKLPARSSLYLHARATGLLARRNRNLRGVAERIMECVDSVDINGNTVLRAVRIYASIAEDGQWREPVRHSIVTHIHKFERPAAQPDAISAENAAAPRLAAVENKALGISMDEILIATPNASRGESSD